MNYSEFKELADKFISGNISEAEKERLFEYYENAQNNQNWDEVLMGNRDLVKKRIYNNILLNIYKKEGRRWLKAWRVAASAILIAGIGLFGWRYFLTKQPANNAVAYHTVTAKDHVIKMVLADGTQVWVNNGSRLRYPEKFNAATREVFLEGEAFFNVVHQNKPFIIRSGKLVTQVLGTSFNVRAFTADKINIVTVVSGKVGVTVSGLKQKNAIFLIPNQALAFDNEDKSVKKVNVDAAQAMAWINNKIRFRNTPFAQAMNELESIYGVRIHYGAKLSSCPVFADFNRTDQILKVLNMLARSLNGKAVKKDDQNYYLYGRPCN